MPSSIHTDLKISQNGQSLKKLCYLLCKYLLLLTDYAREYMQEDTYIDFIFTHYMPFHG